jgi:chemotaxis protein methyltransferase CheR
MSIAPSQPTDAGEAAAPVAEAHEGPISLSPRELKRLSELVHARLGITLTEQKRALILGRLQKVVRDLGLGSFDAYCDYVVADKSGKAMDALANRISTNHTFFWREPVHFEYLAQQVLPQLTERLRKQGTRDLRLWCAASSSGEEPYTLAMILLQHLGKDRPKWKAGLLATDISAKVLDQARAGVYCEERVRALPEVLKTRYLRRAGPDEYQVTDALKAEVTFRRLNLMVERFPFRQPFHVVFLRNVMIYFDRPTREGLIARMAEVMEPGGHLFIGNSESLGPSPAGFRFVRPAVYRRES